jgi:hypothetical protein
MKSICVWTAARPFLILATVLQAQTPQNQPADAYGNPYNVRKPVTQTDLRIAQRAREILNSAANWNRADTRVCRVQPCKLGCPSDAKTFSLYCALKKATEEVKGSFDHRGAAMQEARFVIDEIATNRKGFQHRLQGYNNDPTTTFADIQKVLRLLEDRTSKRLMEAASQTNQK